jgi:hypothetical protein
LQGVAGGVDRDDPEHLMAVDQADDRHEPVDAPKASAPARARAGDQGRVYLIERHLPSMAELDGLVADYLALATQLDRPPLRSGWLFTDA